MKREEKELRNVRSDTAQEKRAKETMEKNLILLLVLRYLNHDDK
jgi:hypothetical protein